jgi:magnesium chelatase subunit H
VRVAIVTLDNHLAGAVRRAEAELRRDIPGLRVTLHAAADWAEDAAALAACRDAIANADLIVASMLFVEEHVQAVLPALAARAPACDALVGMMSASEVVKLTRLGPYRMDGSAKGPLALLKKLKPKSKAGNPAGGGAEQMAMLRRLPKLLAYVPGAAQDVRAYLLALQYWLAGSEENVASLIRMLVDRYADGPRRAWRGALKPALPIDYPDVGVYHPRLAGRIAEQAQALPAPDAPAGTVGLLILRSYVLAGDAAHYDGVIAALESKGLRVVPAFANGLDARPAIERFFRGGERPAVDSVVSLTGFSLVGGPAYNDSAAAQAVLQRLDVPYVAAHPLEFQTFQQWSAGSAGLTPLEATLMVAIPELDGAILPTVFGGRSDDSGAPCTGCDRRCAFPPSEGLRQMAACPERAEMLAARVARLIALRKTPRRDRKLATVLFNFPPNAGAAGTAAQLAVWESLHATLIKLAAEGYTVDVPSSVERLRDRVLAGNAARFGTDANVHARVPTDAHVRGERHLREIEAVWGRAPGRHGTDGASLLILGERFGNVFVGLQPATGVEGDPMRLMFEGGFAPTHAFAAFYRWIREDFAADALLHFGTHGALEFMPGKQVAMSDACWPERLIGDLPHLYLYAANNPSEGLVAKRRSGATLVGYLTPPVTDAGLYRGLAELKALLDQRRGTPPEHVEALAQLDAMIAEAAEALNLIPAPTSAHPRESGDPGVFDRETALGFLPADPTGHEKSLGPRCRGDERERWVVSLSATLAEYEATLIPDGLHVLGRPFPAERRADLLLAAAEARELRPTRTSLEALIGGATPGTALRGSGLSGEAAIALFADLAALNAQLQANPELDALVRALDGGYVPPAPGGDLIRTPEMLPTGRNLHGFDPFRIPSVFAVADGARQAERLLARHAAEGAALPESVAVVLWGTDNLKRDGAPLAQALALMGAEPRFDGYGRLAGAELIPLETLGRPRIDVICTVSGIFRDLLPLQVKLLADAAWLAASADEPEHLNFVRKRALAHAARLGCDLETAALRVFSNAEGAYGSSVNQLIDSAAWDDESQLADAFETRKAFAYGRSGRPTKHGALLKEAMAGVDLAYQCLDSVELGVTTIDHYVDTLGGVARSVERAKGRAAPVYIGDQTQGAGKVRTLAEQVTLETRTRVLNPRWYEGQLRHGAEGVRQIEAQVTNTLGWSATTGEVAPWVYREISETFVLDAAMRERLAALNPKASVRMAARLLEASDRAYWTPDAETLAALRAAGDDLEDRLEGIGPSAAAA